MQLDLTERATASRNILLDSIAEHHTILIAENVEAAIKICLDSILLLPRKWPEVSTKEFGILRKAVVKNLTVILYRIEGDMIQVVDILDSRTDWK